MLVISRSSCWCCCCCCSWVSPQQAKIFASTKGWWGSQGHFIKWLNKLPTLLHSDLCTHTHTHFLLNLTPFPLTKWKIENLYAIWTNWQRNFMKVLISIKWIENWEVMSMKHELGSSSSSSGIENKYYGNLIVIKWIENWKISLKRGWGSRSIEKKWKFEHHIEWIAY